MLVLVAALISAWPELPLERHSPAAARSDVAVIPGIDDYFMLPDIDGAADSATDWFRFFVDTQGVPAERVFLLRNADVTKEQLTDVTRKAATLAGPTDTLWVVVVGHGVPGTDGDGVFLTVDTQANERSIEARGISQGALLAAATGSQAQTVGVFDACFSGTSARGPLLDNVQFTMPLRRVEPRSKTVIFSASAQTAGPLPGRAGPALSYLLIGALLGWGDVDGDGVVGAKEATSFVSSTMQRVIRDRDQKPSLVGDDIVLTRPGVPRKLDLGDVLASATTPTAPSPPPTTTTTTTTMAPKTTMAATAARSAVFDEAWSARRIRMSADQLWVRGDYATPLTDADLIDAGGELAPGASDAIEDIAFRESVQELVWVLPPVGSMALGAGVGVFGAAAYNANVVNDNPERAYLFGSFIGVFAGASVGALAVSMPLGAWSRIDDDDKARRQNARAELAEAANRKLRQELRAEAEAEATK